MKKLTYAEQLKHPNWQRKRLEVLESAGFECSNCGDKETMLHVHHKRYVRGRQAWEYEAHELAALCEKCHKSHHDNEALLSEIMAQAEAMTGCSLPVAIGLLAGYFAAELSIDPDLQQKAIEVDGHSHDLGMLAGMASCASWPQLVDAAQAVLPKPPLTPSMEIALARWLGID